LEIDIDGGLNGLPAEIKCWMVQGTKMKSVHISVKPCITVKWKIYFLALCLLPFLFIPSVHAASFEPIQFQSLPGWSRDNHAIAFTVFLKSCSFSEKEPSTVEAIRRKQNICIQARHLATAGAVSAAAAKSFFETYFSAFRMVTPPSFYTAYYEPVLNGARHRTDKYFTPLLRRPPDSALENIPVHPIMDKLTAVRHLPSGKQFSYPNRSAIEAGALQHLNLELVWLDPVDAFFTHIQGSARIRFEDGGQMRVAFAGRNGHPYTPIGRVLIERGEITPQDMTMASLKSWLWSHPSLATEVMQKNNSYIFFKEDKKLKNADGPRGAADISLTPGRSLAVDPRYWPYGTPIWVNVEDEKLPPRLMIAQDAGSAIKGVARADIFLGTGDNMGRIAGSIKHTGDFIVLVPRGTSP
jgi:membrane-bound lytic murein transglycosylase A